MSKKILLVDDDRVLLKFASDFLEKEGHEVATAQDGFAALNLLTSFYPDIMFFDLIMPKIDGDKLCHIVRKMPHLKDCYLVILSAAVAELDFDHTEIGADAYIAKGHFDLMGKHLLSAIEASEVPRQDDEAKPIKGIENVFPTEEGNKEDTQLFRVKITCRTDKDLRAEIYKKIKETDWILLELVQETKSLEHIFRDLTKEN